MTKGRVEAALVGDKNERRYFGKSLRGKVRGWRSLGEFYIKGLTGGELSATELFALPATPVTRND